MIGILPPQPADPVRERLAFNDGWRFAKGDVPDTADDLAYAKLKPWLLSQTKPNPPAGGPFAEPMFDDSAWRPVRLPHDWGIEGPFRQGYPGETGKLPGGEWAGTASGSRCPPPRWESRPTSTSTGRCPTRAYG